MLLTVILILGCIGLIALTFGTLRERFIDTPQPNAEQSFYDFHDELVGYASKIEKAVAASFSDSIDPENDAVRFLNDKAAAENLQPYNWKRYNIDRRAHIDLIGKPEEYMDLAKLLRIVVEEQIETTSQLLGAVEGFDMPASAAAAQPPDCCAAAQAAQQAAKFAAVWIEKQPKIDTAEYRAQINAAKEGIAALERIKKTADKGSAAVINDYAPDARNIV